MLSVSEAKRRDVSQLHHAWFGEGRKVVRSSTRFFSCPGPHGEEEEEVEEEEGAAALPRSLRASASPRREGRGRGRGGEGGEVG